MGATRRVPKCAVEGRSARFVACRIGEPCCATCALTGNRAHRYGECRPKGRLIDQDNRPYFFVQVPSLRLLIGQPFPSLGHFQQRTTVLPGREALGHETAITRNPPILFRSTRHGVARPIENNALPDLKFKRTPFSDSGPILRTSLRNACRPAIAYSRVGTGRTPSA